MGKDDYDEELSNAPCVAFRFFGRNTAGFIFFCRCDSYRKQRLESKRLELG